MGYRVAMRRLRQIAIASPDLEATVGTLSRVLGLEVAHHDPGVGVFGLRNALLPLGEGGFLEVVTPVQPGTTVGRLLEKQGNQVCGYMVIFQTDDLQGERRRVEGQGLPVVWEIDIGEAATFHLHPKHLGAVVSFDQMKTWADWLWAGPEWRAHRGLGMVTGVQGATVAVPDVGAVEARWKGLLGAEAGAVSVMPGSEGLVEVRLAAGVPVEEIMERARSAGLTVEGTGFRVGTLWVRF